MTPTTPQQNQPTHQLPAAQQAHKGPSAHASPQAEENGILHSIRQHPLLVEVALVIVVVIALGGIMYWQDIQSKVYIEKAEISAPIISLGPMTSGVLEKFYVEEGEQVSQGQRLAVVGNETIVARTAGLVIAIKNTPGQLVGPQDAVVKMIDTQQLRVVGRIQEDKGLKDLKPGQRVVFTVDAFGTREYEGTLESIGQTSRQSDIVFSISDKREAKEFEVKALFDTRAYSELKNGMSAKMWVYR